MKTVRQTPQAINKPMAILGIERGLVAVLLCFAVVVAAKASLVLGAIILVVGGYFAKKLTRQDPDRIKIARQEWKLSPIYDAVKRDIK